MSEDPTIGLPPLTELVGAYETWPEYAKAIRSRAERGWFYAEEAEWLAALPNVLVDRDRWKARALEAEAERDTLAERASEANEREKALEARAKKAEAALEDIEFFDSCDTREAPE